MNRAGSDSPAAGATNDALRDRLAALALGASIEASAGILAESDGYPSLLSPGTRVYVSWIPGTPPDRVVDAARFLRRAGMIPVPHIAARELPDRRAAERLVARLAGETEVTEVLLIAGDAPAARGPYRDSVALLQSGLLETHGIRRIGIAGYPEGHGTIGDGDLRAALLGKMDYASAHGIELYLVSQFCFEGSVILDWMRSLRASGIRLPVRIGVAGPAKVGTLIKYGMRCGIGNSLRYFKTHARQLTQLAAAHGPNDIVLAIARAEPRLDIAGLHFFAFGGVSRTAEWMGRIAGGRFDLHDTGGLTLRDT